MHMKSLSMRVQGKIASKMSSKILAKQIVNGPTADIIENCFQIATIHLGEKKKAETWMKDLIKVVVKVALLGKNEQFTRQQLLLVEEFQRKFELICKSSVAFYQVQNTYDGEFMEKLAKEAHTLLHAIVKNHLTESSIGRIDHVFSLFTNRQLMDDMFDPRSKFYPYLGDIVASLGILIDNGTIGT